jgi:hypothetical protein
MGERGLASLAALLAVTTFAWGQEPDGPLAPLSATFPYPGSLPDDNEPGAFDASPPPKPQPDTSPTPYPGCGPDTWVDAEFLYWFVKNQPMPAPLLTTGPGGPSLVTPGALNSPGTQVLAGSDTVNMGMFPGGRFTVGTWVGGSPGKGNNTIGLEASAFFLGRQSNQSAFTGGPNQPLLTRPIYDTQTNQESALIVASPLTLGGNAGSFVMTSTTELWGTEANAFLPIVGKPGLLWGLLGGFRYLQLDESLNLSQSTQVGPNSSTFFNGLPAPAPLGEIFRLSDTFETRNNFYGGQVGTQMVFRYGALAVTGLAKMAVGSMEQEVNISGQTTLLRPAMAPEVANGGLLTQSSNIGNNYRSEFAWVPEGTLTVSYQISTNFALTAGYTFLYASSVVRPGPQVDRAVNPAELAASPPQSYLGGGDARPAFNYSATSFWAQGLTAGLNISW